jgi:transglutaminase-like putative cysteine protease
VPEFIETSETEFGYEMWSEREIRVRVPDGAAGGNIQIRTVRGNSPPLLFTVTDKPGTKIFRDKRVYTLSTSVNIKTGGAETPNSLYLWIPRPATSASQRISMLESGPMPFMDDYRGTGIYKLENLTANSETQVNVSWKVEVYRVETSVLPQQIRQNPLSPVNTTYTQSNSLIPSDDPRIKNRVTQIIGRERNPYLKARMIYEWLLKELAITEDSIDTDIFAVLETGRADPYTATLLYCALLRGAGVPALPVAGVLVNRNLQTLNHYWAEFWADGFGWIPADPAMAAGAVPAPFQTGETRENFYFGNTDNQRIAFSRGFAALSPMTPGGRTVSPERTYALQSLWEEASGGIESYTSVWGDVIITGIYSQ